MSLFATLGSSVCWLMAILYGLLVACQPLPTGEDKAINNRPQTWTKFVGLVRLEGKSLLETLTVAPDGQRVIDAAHKRELLAEQERVIAELLALSSEIEVLYRYRLVLNAIAVIAPMSLRDSIADLTGVTAVTRQAFFNPPQTEVVGLADDEDNANEALRADSAAFIGSHLVHEMLHAPNRDGVSIPVRGEGIRVAVIDTGIDYTHKMFGGTGNVEDYKNNDPTIVEENSFPTRKVIAGIDLVGNNFDAYSGSFEQQIPRGDADPLDEGTHGTHVAGTVAGHGDGINTHDGVAPDASLLAVKVFGGGATSDTIIIRALEYALDPNDDLDLSDGAHVANLSLGSGFGGPSHLYRDAIRNALRGGMNVVAAAGNSGANDYIVGEPSTAEEAISVAASIDDAEHNWKMPAIKFSGSNGENVTAESVESPMAKPIAKVGELVAPIYHIGIADQDLSSEQQEQLNGKVALIDRGLVTFVEKIDRAFAAGAVGVVMVNNVDTAPIRMGGTAQYDIPAVMIAKQVGKKVKAALANGTVHVTFKAGLVLERKELIDSLAGFSSYGPRDFDLLLKPEIAAPGVSITSAYSGKGDRGLQISGTSMASPHISGVVALLRQYRPDLQPALIKSLLTANAHIMRSPAGRRYRTYQQGAGRVNAYHAATAETVFQPAVLSLGRVLASSTKKIAGHFALQSFSDKDTTLTLRTVTARGLTFSMPAQVTVAAGERERVAFELSIAAEGLKDFHTNLDGYIEAHGSEGQLVARLPLAIGVQRPARVKVERAVVHANTIDESYRAVVDVELTNNGASAGEALLFNLLGSDQRVDRARSNTLRGDNTCDLHSAGYRIVEQEIEEQPTLVLQFAAKLYHPRTTWNLCTLSVQFDSDGDGIANQELIGETIAAIQKGSNTDASMFLSMLTDAHKLRTIQRAIELEGRPRNYVDAVISVLPLNLYRNSTLMVVSARLDDVISDHDGDLHVRLAVLQNDTKEDYLADHTSKWQTITPTLDGVGFWGMPASVMIPSGATSKVTLSKGGDPATHLIAYFPHNVSTFSTLREGQQSQVMQLNYQP